MAKFFAEVIVTLFFWGGSFVAGMACGLIARTFWFGFGFKLMWRDD
jgi:hypothetical protein